MSYNYGPNSVREKIRDEYGETPENLADLGWSSYFLGRLEIAQGAREAGEQRLVAGIGYVEAIGNWGTRTANQELLLRLLREELAM